MLIIGVEYNENNRWKGKVWYTRKLYDFDNDLQKKLNRKRTFSIFFKENLI